MISGIIFASARRRVAGGGGGGGGGSSAPSPPSNLSAYQYAAGARYGIQWSLGDVAATTELFKDGSLLHTLSAGVSSKDIGFTAGDGEHTWKARHYKDGQYSDFSAEITTVDGYVE